MQNGTSDCGLYAIAFATAIAFGDDPGSCLFDAREEEGGSAVSPPVNDRRMQVDSALICTDCTCTSHTDQLCWAHFKVKGQKQTSKITTIYL